MELKEKKEGYSISWKIIAKAKSYSNTTKRCNLCITEKFFILSNPQMATLNKRNELISNIVDIEENIFSSIPEILFIVS